MSGFDNFDLLVGTFRKWQSDIVGVQEVTAPPARASLSTDDRLRGARAVGHGTTVPPFGKCAASARTAESPCVFGELLHERGEEVASRDKFYARV